MSLRAPFQDARLALVPNVFRCQRLINIGIVFLVGNHVFGRAGIDDGDVHTVLPISYGLTIVCAIVDIRGDC